MFRRFGPNYMLGLYVLDLASTFLALWGAHEIGGALPGARVPFAVYLLAAAVFGVVLPMASLYDARRIFRAVDEVQHLVVGTAGAALVLAGALFLTFHDMSRLIFLWFIALVTVLMVAYRALLRLLWNALHRNGDVPVRVLIAGAGALGRQVAHNLRSARVAIAGFVEDDPKAVGAEVDGHAVIGRLEDIPAIVERDGVTDVVFALPQTGPERLANVLVRLWKLSLRVHMIPDFFDLGFARTHVDYLGGITVIGLREPAIDGFQRVAKRLLDLLFGSLIFAGALPVMAAVAILIRVDSPGPIIFRQQRVGENGRLFTMFKFRTMVADAEQRQDAVNTVTASGKIIHKHSDDPRVTRVGRWLRRFSLDELPQLVNVLRGEMSLVGPRPELPWIVAHYEPWQYQRLAVPQGMTSWYVVNGRSAVPMHLNTEEDLRYVRDYSLLQDIKILWKSLGAVLKRKGAF